MKDPLLDNVLRDLAYLKTEWDQDIKTASIRASGVVIRKLLRERGKGNLVEAWRKLAFKGLPKLKTYTVEKWVKEFGNGKWNDDIYTKIAEKSAEFGNGYMPFNNLRPLIPPENKLWLATAGGAFFGGVGISGTVIGMKPPSEMFSYFCLKEGYSFGEGYESAREGDLIEVKELSLYKFLESPCIFVFGKYITRADLIDYVCNKYGLVHLDEARWVSEDTGLKYMLLDLFTVGPVHIKIFESSMDMVLFEFLATGQSIIYSEDVIKLIDTISSSFREESS